MATGLAHPRGAPGGSRKSRGWGRLWQTPVFLVGIVCLAATAATAPWRNDPARDFQRDLRQLRRALTNASHLSHFESLVAQLDRDAERFPQHQGEYAFVTGSYYFQRGERDVADPEWRKKAAGRLAAALAAGPPAADQPMLFYRLGMARYRLGQEPVKALGWVRQGLDMGAEQQAAGYDFLVDAYLKLPDPDLASALAASQKHLEYADDRNIDILGKARFRHAEILYRLERRPDALRELSAVDGRCAPIVKTPVRLLQAICSEEEGDWMAANRYWRELAPLAAQVPGGPTRIHYALGLAASRIEPPDYEAAEKFWRKAVAGKGDEAQAAALRLGRVLVFGSHPDAEEAVHQWQSALSAVRVAADYHNHYVDAEEAVELLAEAQDRFLEKRDYQRALAVADLLTRLAAPGVAEERRGEVSARWGKDLAERAERNPDKRDALLADAWHRFQNAGDDFAQAALTREAADKVELYGRSSENYLAGRDYAKAALVLEKFVSAAGDDAHRAQGHFALAETYEAQRHVEKARTHYHKCIELNTGLYEHLARLQLAHLEIAAKHQPVARDIYVQILQRVGPDMPRKLYEDTHFELANLLYDMGEYDESAVRLREAVRRFPDHAGVWIARTRLGDYYWKQKAKKLVPEEPGSDRAPLAEAVRVKHREYLSEALKVYEDLDADLISASETRTLTPKEKEFTWMCRFYIGLIKVDLEEYTDAFRYFHSLQVRYGNAGEYLTALYAAGNARTCWLKLDRPQRSSTPMIHLARESFESAKADLKKIPSQEEEKTFEKFTRQQWEQWLGEWETALRQAAAPVTPTALAPKQ
jgi:tetratricopeptide (TPR) repeat protein